MDNLVRKYIQILAWTSSSLLLEFVAGGVLSFHRLRHLGVVGSFFIWVRSGASWSRVLWRAFQTWRRHTRLHLPARRTVRGGGWSDHGGRPRKKIYRQSSFTNDKRDREKAYMARERDRLGEHARVLGVVVPEGRRRRVLTQASKPIVATTSVPNVPRRARVVVGSTVVLVAIRRRVVRVRMVIVTVAI
jgi:hypothetical protein